MMKHSDSDDSSDTYPPPFSLNGGLLSALRENREDHCNLHDFPAKEESTATTDNTTPMESNDNTNNEGTSNDTDQTNTETTVDAALLLASVAEIASKEIVSTPPPDEKMNKNNASAVWTSATSTTMTTTPSPPPMVSPVENNNAYQTQYEDDTNLNGSNRIRAVSITSPVQLGHGGALEAPPTLPFQHNYHNNNSNSNLEGERSSSPPPPPPPSSTPPPLSPHCAGRRPRSVSESSISPIHVGNGVYRDLTPTLSSLTLSPGVAKGNDVFHRHTHHNHASSGRLLAAATHPLEEGQGKEGCENRVKMILRKKFSWKNYPELEAFLIANREEYLRHSTLNYTVQQKQYNNSLTERMLELAAENGYVFDEHDFSFVTVRDRIRCYYKSYVQSLKKRGVLIGYAARKAGLVSEVELERSAAKAGTIYIPHV